MDMLARYQFSDCTPVQTPINPGIILSEAQCPSTPEEVEEMRHIPYISAVGSLLYLAIATRPDIAYSVGVLLTAQNTAGTLLSPVMSVNDNILSNLPHT